MQEHTFAYTIWGIYPTEQGYQDSKWFLRRTKIDNDIRLYLANPYSPKAVVYVYGIDNFKRLTDIGLVCKLIDKNPCVFDMVKEQYAHKLYSWQAALQDFKSVIFLDFDTIKIKPLPSDFWQVMDEGEPVKATLFQYHLKRVDRPGDERKVSSASFVYIRGKEHADNIIQTWKDMGKPWKEEYPFTKYIDSFSGGWKGVENYKKHDVPYYELQKISGLEKENKNLVFEHFNFHGVAELLKDVYGVKDKIDKLEKNKCPAMPA